MNKKIFISSFDGNLYFIDYDFRGSPEDKGLMACPLSDFETDQVVDLENNSCHVEDITEYHQQIINQLTA